MRLRRSTLGIAMTILAGCLPSDTRPVPGSMLLNVVASDAAIHGFTTSDGWTIHFVRVLTAVGSMQLQNYPDHSTSCNDYSDPGYNRLFDFTKLTSPAKLGISYGLGTCSVQYRFRAPNTTDLLETGTTAADLTLLQTDAMDAGYGIDGRVAFYVEGAAEKPGVTKTFQWMFRRGYSIDQCAGTTAGTFDSIVDIHGNDALTMQAVVRPEELFRSAAKDDAPLVFETYAAADGNGDGDVSLDELTSVPPPPGAMSSGAGGAGGTGGAGGMGSMMPPRTLGDFVYDVLLGRVTRIDGGGPCEAMPRGGGGGG